MVEMGAGGGGVVREWPLGWGALFSVVLFHVPRPLPGVLALWECS